MSTTTKETIINPTAHDHLDCKRLYMSLWSLERTLDGPKSVTRRLLNPQPPTHADRVQIRDSGPAGHHENGNAVWAVSRDYEPGEIRLLATPHWRFNATEHPYDDWSAKGDEVYIWDEVTDVVRTDGPRSDSQPAWDEPSTSSVDWHEIHAGFLMPRWACRAAVRIVDVRVERLGAIAGETWGYIREGVPDYDSSATGIKGIYDSDHDGNAEALFQKKWEALHGADSWDPEQWVRRIEYEPIHP